MKLNISEVEFSKNDLRKGLVLPEKIDEDLSEEIGLHLGDGSMNFYKNKGVLKGCYQLRGHISEDKSHYDTRIKGLYQKLYGLNLKMKRMPSTGVYGFQIWSDGIVNFKSKVLGLPLGNKLYSRIPSFISKKESMNISFIRGFFDTDGCFNVERRRDRKKVNPRICISNTSMFVLNEISKILNLLDIKNSLYRYKRPEKNWNDLYHLSVKGDLMVSKWFRIIQPNNQKHNERYQSYLDIS